jgi:hypothetical protein
VHTNRDLQRRPSLAIFLVPDLDFGPVRGQQADGGGHLFVCRAVHRGFAVLVHSVDVVPNLEGNLDGFDHLVLSAGVFWRRIRTHACSDHERRRAVCIRN